MIYFLIKNAFEGLKMTTLILKNVNDELSLAFEALAKATNTSYEKLFDKQEPEFRDIPTQETLDALFNSKTIAICDTHEEFEKMLESEDDEDLENSV